jgi:hypothetical protein
MDLELLRLQCGAPWFIWVKSVYNSTVSVVIILFQGACQVEGIMEWAIDGHEAADIHNLFLALQEVKPSPLGHDRDHADRARQDAAQRQLKIIHDLTVSLSLRRTPVRSAAGAPSRHRRAGEYTTGRSWDW